MILPKACAEPWKHAARVSSKSCQRLVVEINKRWLVAKWLVRDADVFLFDEPTRGIDVAARRRIYRLFDSLRDDGKAIVIVSSDLDELMETCDRIAVMSAGKLVATFDRSNWSHDKIMQASFSGYLDQAADKAEPDA